MSTANNQLTAMRLRFRWILVSAAGMATAGVVARPLSYVVGEAVGAVLGDIPAVAAIGAVAGGGALGGVALAQWFVLRRQVLWAGRWPAALALAGAAAAAAGFAADEALLPGAPPPVPLAFGVAAFVLVHWFLLREHVARAGWLAAATAGAFLVAAAATAGAGALVGFENESPLFGALFGAVYGWITVLALGRLARDSG